MYKECQILLQNPIAVAKKDWVVLYRKTDSYSIISDNKHRLCLGVSSYEVGLFSGKGPLTNPVILALEKTDENTQRLRIYH